VLSGLVDDLAHRLRREVDEHKVDDRMHPVAAAPIAAPVKPSSEMAYRSSALARTRDRDLCMSETAATLASSLSEVDDRRIVPHGVGDRVANGFNTGLTVDFRFSIFELGSLGRWVVGLRRDGENVCSKVAGSG